MSPCDKHVVLFSIIFILFWNYIYTQEAYVWRKESQEILKNALNRKLNTNVAKNVILFIGDGMGVSTVTAARILRGQKQGRPGEETILEFEKFPHVALSKTCLHLTVGKMEESSATADNYNERFAILSEADRDKLLSNKNAESTKAATKYAVKTFHDYCMAAANYQTIVAIDLLPDNALDQLLEKFYPSLRNKNGEKYYTEPPRRREINIISGENFNRSKAMFEAVCIDLKKSGLGDVTHKPVIHDEDMAKISAYFKTWKTDPVVLIRKRPRPNYHTADETWFENKPLGKNTLGALMAKISNCAGLSKVYTNHSIRSTSITTLSESGFEDRKIKTVSKHKSLQSIESYSRDSSLPQKKKMSKALASSLYSTTAEIHVPSTENNAISSVNNINHSTGNAVAIRAPTTVAAVPHSVQNTNASSTCMQLDDIDFLDDSFISESADFDQTYNIDKQTSDSGATATALMAGIKANYYTIGVDGRAKYANCSSIKNAKVDGMVNWSKNAGKSTGIVTSTRVTHATPAAAYAHAPQREWESDIKLPANHGECKDIAYQLIVDQSDMQVILGGGRQYFMTNTSVDPETKKVNSAKGRRDGLDLIQVCIVQINI
ncbi:E3.1.3.1 [Mytilus edulis]|uniref:Alkaline phosphatase, tissue-nonspecific isozyme n=1 Tax=Mytilus edulis TaxID=6550 RepID=A0A8S3U4L6_MYTED|nr:E3.1.3.1 [Mytilus edulis]